MGFIFEKSFEVDLPLMTGVFSGTWYLALLIFLYIFTIIISRLAFKKFPLFLTNRGRATRIILKSIILFSAMIYTGSFLIIFLCGWLTGSMGGDRGLAFWLLSFWAPIWISIPLGTLVSDLKLRTQTTPL